MKGAEMFMGLLCSTALCSVGLLGRLAVQHRHLAAGLQPVLPLDHDLLVRLEPGIDQRLSLADLRHRDRAHLHRAVGPDHIDICAVRPLLHRRGRER